MVITSTTKIVIKHNTTAEQLVKALSTIPGNATINLVKTKYYDQRDPGESYIEATWSEIK